MKRSDAAERHKLETSVVANQEELKKPFRSGLDSKDEREKKELRDKQEKLEFEHREVQNALRKVLFSDEFWHFLYFCTGFRKKGAARVEFEQHAEEEFRSETGRITGREH